MDAYTTFTLAHFCGPARRYFLTMQKRPRPITQMQMKKLSSIVFPKGNTKASGHNKYSFLYYSRLHLFIV